MRLWHRDGQTIHLGYCTNVHPGEDLPEIMAQLGTLCGRGTAAGPRRSAWCRAVAGRTGCRAARGRPGRGGLGSAGSFSARGLEVVTFNGFPYQSFHAPVVKYAVYQPDWLTRERMDYTVNLARILAGLLPADAARGSVSTLPLAWRTPWTPQQSTTVRQRLDELAGQLAVVRAQTGRLVRVAFEPEPGCVVESTAQAAAELSGTDPEYLGVCLDLAHLACAWEEPAAALARLAAAGLPVVKVQVSAALGAERPDEADTAAALRGYAEPRFLHQTRSAAGQAADDLAQALDAHLPGPWRVHFHVPVHAAPQPPLHSTIDVLRTALAVLVGGETAVCDHLDVETYTWSVLPAAQRPASPAELAEGIAAELRFTRDELLARGLSERSPAEA